MGTDGLPVTTESLPRGSRAGRWARRMLVPLVVIWALMLPVRSSVLDWSHIPSPSMTPTIVEGDNVLVNKVAFGLRIPFTHSWVGRWSEPEPGDIVLLYSPETRTRLVKRVVGLPGDRVELRDGVLYVNDEPSAVSVVDPAVEIWTDGHACSAVLAHETLWNGCSHEVLLSASHGWLSDYVETRVPAGQCFVLGDNRDDSCDSRVFGCVPLEHVEGRVSWVTCSLDRERLFALRLDRIFARIAAVPAAPTRG